MKPGDIKKVVLLEKIKSERPPRELRWPDRQQYGAEGTSASDFLTYSEIYLEAARELHDYKGNVWHPMVNSIGISLELALKAFLMVKGESLNNLKNLGHHLDKLLCEADERGILDCVQFKDHQVDSICRLNEYYGEPTYFSRYPFTKDGYAPNRILINDTFTEICIQIAGEIIVGIKALISNAEQ